MSNNWNDLLHSSSKLIEDAKFPPIQRDLEQLESISIKLMAKRLPETTEAPSQSTNGAARSSARKVITGERLTRTTEAPSQSNKVLARFLARKRINAEKLSHGLKKSLELKARRYKEDVKPEGATTVTEYLQQVHEMEMESALNEARGEGLRSFSLDKCYRMEEDWRKEKRRHLQSLSRISRF